jgi:hypothetical protein
MVLSILSSVILLISTLVSIEAAPYQRRSAALASDVVSGFTPFTQFARAAYCDPTKLTNWTCGGKYDRLYYFQLAAHIVVPKPTHRSM